MTNDRRPTTGEASPRWQTKLLFCLYALMTAVGVHSLLFVEPVTVTLVGTPVPATAFYTAVAFVGLAYFGLKLLVES